MLGRAQLARDRLAVGSAQRDVPGRRGASVRLARRALVVGLALGRPTACREITSTPPRTVGSFAKPFAR
jgi:hypothetical protein